MCKTVPRAELEAHLGGGCTWGGYSSLICDETRPLCSLQDPVIFSGTVRSNLDPFCQATSDTAIWEALTQAGVDGFVRDMKVGVTRCNQSLRKWGDVVIPS